MTRNAELFEEYLKEVHALSYRGTDDDMSENYEKWRGELEAETLIELANEAMQLQADLNNLNKVKVYAHN